MVSSCDRYSVLELSCGEFDRSACTRNSSKSQDVSISQDASIRSGAARMCLFKSISLYIHRVHALTYYILDPSIRHTSMSRRYSAYSDLVCYQRQRGHGIRARTLRCRRTLGSLEPLPQRIEYVRLYSSMADEALEQVGALVSGRRTSAS